MPIGLALDTAQVIAAAQAGNPALNVQRVALEGAELELSNARHARLPTLSVTGSYGLSGYELGEGYAGAFNEMTSGDFRNRYLGADFSAPLGGRAPCSSYGMRLPANHFKRCGAWCRAHRYAKKDHSAQ